MSLDALPVDGTDDADRLEEVAPAIDTTAETEADSAMDLVDGAPDETLDLEPEIEALPLCVQACDRAVDCAVGVCGGVDWQTAGVAFARCAADCDDFVADRVLAAGSCEEVVAEVRASLTQLTELCDTDPCALACETLASCVVDACPAVGPEAFAPIVADCTSTCGPGIADVLATPCQTLIATASANDPGFAQFCGTAACAPLETCVQFATKSTECILAHCGGNADPFASGLHKALASFCGTAPDCPPPVDVAAMLNPALTCDSPPFDQFGTAAPFTALCAGTLGVGAAELIGACDVLAGCSFIPATDTDLCAVYLAMTDSPSTLAACVDAAGDCTAAAACLP